MELQKRGCLGRLITSYPAFETIKYGVERVRIKPLVAPELIDRLWRKAPGQLKKRYNPQYLMLMHELFDPHASRSVPEDTDPFVRFSSFSLHSLRRAMQLGAKSVLEFGLSHMLHQRDILQEEYGRYGIEPHTAHPKIVEMELTECEETDYVCVPSCFVKRTFLDRGFPTEKLLHVPYGVSLDQFYPVPKPDEVFRIIHGGHLSLGKGVHYLLQAVSELNLPDAEL
jgi:hypothetical protein